MKKVIVLLFVALVLTACGEVEPDYNTEELEEALNNGENPEGEIVSVEVGELVPDSAFGYNIQAGEHLNFISDKNPEVEAGDEIIVEVEEVKSALGSYMITYKKK